MKDDLHGPIALELLNSGIYMSPVVQHEWENEKRKYLSPQPQLEPVRSAVKQYDLDQSPDYRKGYEDGRRNGYEVGKRHAAPQSELSDALRTLLDFQNDVEVMGEWEAQEINHKMLKKARARQAEIVTKCRAVLAAQAGLGAQRGN